MTYQLSNNNFNFLNRAYILLKLLQQYLKDVSFLPILFHFIEDYFNDSTSLIVLSEEKN